MSTLKCMRKPLQSSEQHSMDVCISAFPAYLWVSQQAYGWSSLRIGPWYRCVRRGRRLGPRYLCLDFVKFSPLYMINLSSHEFQRPQKGIAKRTHLQHLEIDMQQQDAPLDTSSAGARDSMLAVGLSGQQGHVEIMQLK